ncbi:hypothetical protein B566_EDAN005875 [Ephemera danica]|nr:hypothetical protein B566_EDAN005875 [Ephemera danica]
MRWGYYSIEQKVRKLRLVALNTNLYARKGGNRLQALHPETAASSSLGGDDDPGGQWAWLEAVLDKCMRSRETVYLIGHAAPGADERHTNGNGHEGPFQERYNQRYLQIVRKYASIIVGQFFGHLHADTFRVVYNEHGICCGQILTTLTRYP